ncbi:Reticulocyte-binding protein 2 homolog a [Durusdinium trenchii]|uniref:Reticulocyte-binding protein 2 homolog a n=1 Tax=Durusdinium trenchii TaxID=1381693 RepID=A0ABP0MC93_9DINO
MGRSGAFGAFAAAASLAEPAKQVSKSPEVSKLSGAPPAVPQLGLEEVRALLEELRTVSSSAKFQKDLQQLRSLDWGAFKKREAVAKLLSIFWKAPLRRFGFSIDGHGFPHLLQVVKANAHQPGIRLMSHEVEKQLRMVPGSLFGLTADAKSWKEADSQQAERVNGNVNGKAATVAKDLRGRPMFLGEAKEILKAFKESLLCPAVVRSMQNIEQRGGVRMEQHRRVLITQEWNPIMKRFDFPTTEAGYEAMKVGIRQFAENDYVRSSSHEVERLCGAPAGSYFGIPTEEEMAAGRALEEKRKAEEARKAEERRKAAEEERKKREEEARRRDEEEAKRKRDEEEARRKEEEEVKRKREEEEVAKRRREEEEVRRKKEEEEAKRKEEQEANRRKEEEASRRKEEEEASREEADTMRPEDSSERREEPAEPRATPEMRPAQPPPCEEVACDLQEEACEVSVREDEEGKAEVKQESQGELSEHSAKQKAEEERRINGDAKLEADLEARIKRSEEAKDAATKEELGPTPQPEISAPRDRHTIDSPAIPELPEPPNTLCFETSVQLPLFRATSATTEDVVGVAPLGARLRGTVEETNWLRLLPQSCRALGALAEVAYLPLEELVPAIGSDPVAVGHAGRFRVSAKQAAVRAHPELRGKVVGVVHVGRMLMGTPHKVAGHLWLRFEGSSWRKVADEEAWALIQDVCGASILEPLDADGQRALRSYQGSLAPAAPPPAEPSSAPPAQLSAPLAPATAPEKAPPAEPAKAPAEKQQTPVTDPVKVAQRMDAASLARKQLQGPLEYRVLAEDHSAPVRKEPLVQSPQVGKLERGELVYGYPGGGWLQLAECDLENSWVFIGQRLLACWGELRVTARTYDALEVTWPGLHQEKRVAYNVEWRTPEGAAKQMRGHKVSASNKVVVGNLPQGLLCLRVGARVAGEGNNDEQDVKLWGSWVELQAGDA